MADHIRIDEGVKRGAGRKYTPRPPVDPITQRVLPKYAPEQRHEIVLQACHRIAAGERLVDVVHGLGITPQALSLWLLDDVPEAYKAAQRIGLISKIVASDEALATADNPLDLARAREQAKFSRWDAERRLPHLFSPKQEVTHNLPAGPMLVVNLVAAPQQPAICGKAAQIDDASDSVSD